MNYWFRLNFFSSLFVILLWTTNSFAQGEDCATALQINTVSNYCSGIGFYNNNGSSPGVFGNATCFPAAATEDVWFQFTAIGTDVLISIGGAGNGGTMINPSVALYIGSCATTLNELDCASALTGTGIVQLYQGALNQGSTYYIRVSTLSTNEGSFELCINNYTPSANPGADCGGAAFLCNQNPISVGTLSGGGLNNDEPEPSSCLENSSGPDEGNSSWFYWTCGTSGTFILDITPLNPTDDIDFIIYELNGPNPCGPRTVLRCNAASCLNSNGSTGLDMLDISISENPGCYNGANAYCQFINMTAGSSYALLVNNFSANMGFTVNFGGTATFQGPDPNIIAAPLSICAGGTVVFNGSTSVNCVGGLNWNFSNGGSQPSAAGAGPHSISYSTPGIYTAILNGSDNTGCLSTETVTITVTPGPNSPIVNNVSLCQYETPSQLTATGTNILWYTTAIGGIGSSSAPTPSTSSTGTFSYFVSQTINGCESPRAQLNVIVTPLPTMTVPASIIECSGSTIPEILFNSPTNGVSYSWTSSNTTIGLAASGNGSVPSFVALNNTQTDEQATITVIPSAGSCSGLPVNFTLTIHPLPDINAGVDLDVCSGGNVTLNGSGGSNLFWNNGVSNGIAFVPSSSMTYTVTGTSSFGCINSDEVLVTVHPNPVVSAGNDITICPNSFITLSGSGAATYSWDYGVTNGIAFIPSTGISTYVVTGTSTAGCIGTDTISIAFYSIENVSFTQDTTLGCSPLLVNFTNTTSNSVSCFWNFGNGNISNACGVVNSTFTEVGCNDISLTVTFGNGCTNTLIQPNLVCVEGPPIASFVTTPSFITEYDSQATFNNTTIGGSNYSWNFGDNSAISTLTSPVHDYAGMPLGNYLVTLIAYSPSGCIDSISSIIQIKEDLLFYVPNSFTPDQDEFNQIFKPVFTSGYDPFNYNLFIFNRWGQLIFESHDASQGWDGTYGNDEKVQIVQDGIYTWKIEFKISGTDEKRIVTGHVNVLR